MNIFGIDYGSKLAGTTVIAHFDEGKTAVYSTTKGQDADAFITEMAQKLNPTCIYLDAPLSLPGVYTGISHTTDFFYREADRQLQAMSPMFLGGLTARAMRLAKHLSPTPILEVYPGAWAQRWRWKDVGYKKDRNTMQSLLDNLKKRSSVPLPQHVQSWHALDALLALHSGFRHQKGTAEIIGLPEEGTIII